MNAVIVIVLLQLFPDGVVLKITKEANVPSLDYCLARQREIFDFHEANPQEFLKLISVTCKEEVHT